MADLDVQPKKKGSILPWILLGLGLIALLIFLARGCNDRDGDDDAAGTRVDTAANNAAATTNRGDDWNEVDFNAPAVRYDEVTNRDIDVRGNNNYGIYGVGESILFDEGKSTLRSGAEANLRQIVGSIDKRYSGSNVRVYGYTDAVGSAGYNKQLAEQRAETVRNWLVKNGNITENRISVHPVGEARPVASNSTEQGRQQNRRVEIVARGAGSGSGMGTDTATGGTTGAGR
jgi:outer membrane protein OmpA-like peptidoglycan-associated protein